MLLLYAIIPVFRRTIERSLTCDYTCFLADYRKVINLLKSASSNKKMKTIIRIVIIIIIQINSNKTEIMKCRTGVFFGGFRQFSAYFGHWVYFGLSSNCLNPIF